jgi:uncharacterized membrane protein YbhN (UPF0104 family)
MRQAARWLFALALVYLVVRYLQQHPAAVASLRTLEGWRLIIATLLLVVAIMLHALRTYLIIRRHTPPSLTYRRWLDLVVRARILNMAGSQLGNLYRARKLKHGYDVAYGKYVSSFGFFTWVDTAVNLALAIVLLVLFQNTSAPPPVAAGSVALFLGLWLLILPAASVFRALIGQTRVANRVLRACVLSTESFINDFRSAAGNLPLVLSLALLGLVAFSNLNVVQMLIFTGLGAEVTLSQLVVVIVLYRLSLLVILTPGNVGVTEWTVGGACLLVGIDVGAGLMVSLLLRAFTLLALILLAVLRAVVSVAPCCHRDPDIPFNDVAASAPPRGSRRG